MAEPGQLARLVPTRELLVEIVRTQIDPADHCGDARIAAREFEQEIGFVRARTRLHRDAGVDAVGVEQRMQVGGEMVPRQHRHAGIDPRQVRGAVAPEVLVGVDADHRAPPVPRRAALAG